MFQVILFNGRAERLESETQGTRRMDACLACHTPMALFVFNHCQDRQGATWSQQMENLRGFGPPVSVDTERPPSYQHCRILYTDYFSSLTAVYFREL
jgi:hypothetical protein